MHMMAHGTAFSKAATTTRSSQYPFRRNTGRIFGPAGGRVRAPLCVPRRASPEDKGGPEAKGSKEEKEEKIKVYVQALTRGGFDQEVANEILSVWDKLGKTSDPQQLRTMFLKQSLAPAAGILLQLLLDAGAAYCAFASGQDLGAAEPFFGQLIVFLLVNGVGFYFAAGVFMDIFTLGVLVLTTARLEMDAEVFLAAVQQIAAPNALRSLSITEKAAAAFNSIKVAQALDSIARLLDASVASATPKADGSANSTLANLSAYLTLYRSERTDKFDPVAVGMAEADAVKLAGVFAKYDSNDDGRLDQSEVGKLLQQLELSLEDEEVKGVVATLDENKDGFVEFDELAKWWAARRPRKAA